MNAIVTKELRDVRYALGSYDTAKNRYNQIKRTFPDGNEYRIFAEPIILSEGMKITWVTEYEGTVINLSKLSAEEQSYTKEKVSEQIKKLLDAAKKYNDQPLVDFLYQCIEIPNLNDIFIIRKDNIDNMVLTQWGFTSDVPGAQKGLLEKIINAKRVPMEFDVVYPNGAIAADVEIQFEYEGKKLILKSNAQGKITLDKVKVDSYVKAFEIEGDALLNPQGYTCYEGGKYQIKVTQKIDMLFRVITSKNDPVVGEDFIFNYKGEEKRLKTDAKGEIVIPKMKIDVEVKVFQFKDGKELNVNHFISRVEQKEYLIVIQVVEPTVVVPPPPQTYQMKFKVIDDDNKPFVNAEVTLSYDGKTVKLFTDENGYAILTDIKPGTQVKVIAKGEKPKKK